MKFLILEPNNWFATLLLAHGAGGAMDSPAMQKSAEALADAGFKVVRFEFQYMAARRDGLRKPPPRADKLLREFHDAVDALDTRGPLFVGGKSMGGRVASTVADELHAEGKISGLVCLGYPFHPPDKPEKMRTAHLKGLQTPTLICHGSRDPFGTREEVAGYELSDRIHIFWLEDGDHDLKPRKRISGFTASDHLASMAEQTADWAKRVLAP